MVRLDAALAHVKAEVGGLLDANAVYASCAAHEYEWKPGGPAAFPSTRHWPAACGVVTISLSVFIARPQRLP